MKKKGKKTKKKKKTTHTLPKSPLISNPNFRSSNPETLIAMPEAGEMSTEEAIRIIQIHERARQGRLRAKFMADIRIREQLERYLKDHPPKTMSQEAAAKLIQRMIRGYLTRKHLKQKFAQEGLLIGMEMPPLPNRRDDPIVRAEKAAEHRRVLQVCRTVWVCSVCCVYCM